MLAIDMPYAPAESTASRSPGSSASMLAIGGVVLAAMLLPNLRKGKDAALSG